MLRITLATALALTLLAPAARGAQSPANPRAEADRLVAEGATLGEAGEWEAAVGRFKQAEALFPRAIHHCNIGLVYVRWQRWPEAWVHLTRCETRATEALPAWVATRRAEVKTRLAEGDYAPVEIFAMPRGARVLVDRFPGEVFSAPITLWLPIGRAEVRAEAPGWVPASESLALRTTAIRRVDLRLKRVPEPTPEPTLAPQTPPARPRRGGAIATLSVAGASLAAAAALHVVAAGTRDDAEALPAGPEFDQTTRTFERQRASAIALYAIAGATTGLGLWLALRPQDTAGPTAHVAPLPGGAGAWVQASF